MKKFFLFNIKVNCLSIYLTAEKLFFRQEINCNVVFFIQTKYSIKMENKFFKVNSFTNEIGTKQSLFLTRLGDFEGITRFLGGRGGGRGEFGVSIKVSRRQCRKLTANKLQLGEQIWRKS